MKLTPPKLFGSAALTGAVPANLKISSLGHISFTLPSSRNNQQLDLWCLDPKTQQLSQLIEANNFNLPGRSELTTVEKAEQERRRSFNQGITYYEWFPSAETLLIAVDGVLFRHEIKNKTSRPLTSNEKRVTHPRISPLGNYISYVRNGNLFLLPSENEPEYELTHDRDENISNGIPEFIAQEEMHRFDGYWWSPDDRLLAFTRVDSSKIPETYRHEINHSELTVIPQRYPYTGGPNAQVQLGIIEIKSKKIIWLDWQIREDDYLTQVSWSPDSLLVIQAQSRDQKILSTRAFSYQSNKWNDWFEERSDTWIELNNNMSFSPQGLLTVSERSGKSDLAFFERKYPEKGLQTICTNLGRINKIIGNFENHVYVTGWDKDPTTQDLFQISLDGGIPEPITNGEAWHEVVLDQKNLKAASIVSRTTQPLSVASIDIPTKRITRIYDNKIVAGHPYFPFLDSHVLSHIGEIKIDDVNLNYRLTPPSQIKENASYPVIVNVYGGPGVQRVRRDWPPLTNQLFAQHGYGVFELDNRGGGNRDKAFRDVLYGQLGNIEVKDQLAGVEFLKTIPWVDTKRIGLLGHSYGGYMTLMCLCKASDVFAAGVSIAPVVSWKLYDTHYTERYLGTPNANDSAYVSSSIEAYINQLNKPLLLIHGMADDNVLFSNTTILMKALQDQGSIFQLMTYPGSKHSLQEPSVAIHRYQTILDFFKSYL